LGQFKLPVTITPASNTTFFIHPTVGDDTFPGTAAKPWKSVKSVLDITQPPGLKVATVASLDNDVVVTILAAGTETGISNNIATPVLPAGSVTVLQAPFPKTFQLDMGMNKLILNKGYKLQDINITSAFNSGNTPPDPAVSITHPTAGLASVDVKCTATTNKVICVQVKGSGFHILKDVRVDVTDADANNIGILNNDASANLSIVGGEVRLTKTASHQPITLIDSQGVLTVTGLTVDMTGGTTPHTQNSKGIILRAPGSSVTGSTIKVNNGPNATNKAIGIDVKSTASKSTVEGNTFEGFGSNSIGVQGNSYLFFDASTKNTFLGTFGNSVAP